MGYLPTTKRERKNSAMGGPSSSVTTPPARPNVTLDDAEPVLISRSPLPFTDSSMQDYDPAAATLLKQRAFTLLDEIEWLYAEGRPVMRGCRGRTPSCHHVAAAPIEHER